MHKDHGIVIGCGALQEMLAAIVPRFKKRRRNKSFPVTLSFDSKARELFVEEARHGLSGYRIPAVGGWPEKVQVDGTILKLMCDTFRPDDRVELVPLRDELCILREGSRITLKRLDKENSPGIKKKPQKIHHYGPVAVPPDPVGKRVELNDTWLFSARVPMPQHRDKKDNKET